jgi:hypothetical protein
VLFVPCLLGIWALQNYTAYKLNVSKNLAGKRQHPCNMPTARISLTVSSAKMPFLETGKKKKNELGEVLPWERYPGYWDTPHGRLARVAYQLAVYFVSS